MTLSVPEPAASKDVWREWARQERLGLDWNALSTGVVEGIRAWVLPDPYLTVLVYLPLSHEINLVPLTDSDTSTRYVATRTPERGGDLTVHELGGPLEVHRFGFLQPHASARLVPPDEIDIALLPGLAFDLYGNRLGHGAGYFDRLMWLTRPSARRVGVVPADLVVDRLPTEPHDVAVEYLATEEGVIETAGAGGTFPQSGTDGAR